MRQCLSKWSISCLSKNLCLKSPTGQLFDVVLIVAVVRDEAPATCNIKKAIEQEDMLVDGAALVASNYLLSYPNIHHRIGDILQQVSSQLCSHVLVVDAPVVLGLFFGYFDVWNSSGHRKTHSV